MATYEKLIRQQMARLEAENEQLKARIAELEAALALLIQQMERKLHRQDQSLVDGIDKEQE